MRSRQMLVKLDRLDLPSQEPKCPDISLLSPADQDRVFEQFRKIVIRLTRYRQSTGKCVTSWKGF